MSFNRQNVESRKITLSCRSVERKHPEACKLTIVLFMYSFSARATKLSEEGQKPTPLTHPATNSFFLYN